MSRGVDTLEIAYGYDLDRINRLARKCTVGLGMVELLLTASTPPTDTDLVRAAYRCVRSEQNDIARHHGGRASSGNPTGEFGAGPNFVKFWSHHAATPTDFSDKVVEPMALYQVLCQLKPTHYEALMLYAIYNSMKVCAEVLGIPDRTFQARVRAARAAFKRLWFDFETPPTKSPRSPDTCGNGHPKAEFTTAGGGCRACYKAASRRERARRA